MHEDETIDDLPDLPSALVICCWAGTVVSLVGIAALLVWGWARMN